MIILILPGQIVSLSRPSTTFPGLVSSIISKVFGYSDPSHFVGDFQPPAPMFRYGLEEASSFTIYSMDNGIHNLNLHSTVQRSVLVRAFFDEIMHYDFTLQILKSKHYFLVKNRLSCDDVVP